MYPVDLVINGKCAEFEAVKHVFDLGRPVIYYAGCTLMMAAARDGRLRLLRDEVYEYVIGGKRGVLVQRKLSSRADGLHLYEYLAKPYPRSEPRLNANLAMPKQRPLKLAA
jgi:hypothetical protein